MISFPSLRSTCSKLASGFSNSDRRYNAICRGLVRALFSSTTVFAFAVVLLQTSLIAGTVSAQLVGTTTSITASPNPANLGQAVTFTAVVTPQGGGTPTGTITFLDGNLQLGQISLDGSGQAQLSTSGLNWLEPGTSILARYSGDANFTQSSGSVSLGKTFPTSIAVSPNSQSLILGGNSQQYTATGHYADGSSINITALISSWVSSNPSVANISPNGLATTNALAGDTLITAQTGGAVSAPVTLEVKKAGANVMFLGGGSSAMFLELGQSAQSSATTSTPCVWTHSTLLNFVAARDNRIQLLFASDLPIDENGDIWVTWGPGSGTCTAPSGNFDVYAYTSLDSVLGVRCFFEIDDVNGNPGCVQVFTLPAGTAGENKLCNTTDPCVYGPDTAIPQVVINALNLQHWFAAGTDILPEDAKFAVLRMFTPCGSPIWRQPFDQGLRQTNGLGYQVNIPGIGLPVYSYFSNIVFHTLDFNFTGNDPINAGFPVPGYNLTTLGAKPIMIAVSPAGGTGIGAASDINAFTLALFTEGILGRTTDLFGPSTAAPVTTLISEPFSGPYNVMEYSISNSSQFHTSQDENNCDGGGGVYSSALGLQGTNGQIPSLRVRAVGTREMVSQLQAASDGDQRLGYFYWSAANANSFTTANGKYLTVNGVDPLQDNYTDGVLPGVDSAHPLSNVSFKWLNMGDYPIWSVLRIVSKSPTPLGVTKLVSAAQGLNATQHNFLPATNLQVWHSHYYLPETGNGVSALGNTINATGDLCPLSGALPEYGGDLGGANTSKQANIDFCVDFANINGLINKAN